MKTTDDSIAKVKATATVTQISGGLLSSVVIGVSELVGKTLIFELVSAELDPSKFSKYLSLQIPKQRRSCFSIHMCVCVFVKPSQRKIKGIIKFKKKNFCVFQTKVLLLLHFLV